MGAQASKQVVETAKAASTPTKEAWKVYTWCDVAVLRCPCLFTSTEHHPREPRPR